MSHPYGPSYPYSAPYAGPRRPGSLTAGAVLAIVFASLTLVPFVIGFFAVLAESSDPDYSWLWGSGEVVTAVLVLGGFCALCITTIVTAALALGRRRGAWITLLVCTALAIALEALVIVLALVQLGQPEHDVRTFGGDAYYDSDEHEGAAGMMVLALLWVGVTVTSLCLLATRAARAWINVSGPRPAVQGPAYGPGQGPVQGYGPGTPPPPGGWSAPPPKQQEGQGPYHPPADPPF